MTPRGRRLPTDASDLLRLGLVALAALGIAGTTIELVFLGHWTGSQWIVWPVMLALAIGLLVLIARPGFRGILLVRAIAIAALSFSAVGVWFHIQENLDAGPLDRRYADTWEALPTVEQWWLAVSESVGPAPTLAPGSLAEIALALGLATIGAAGRTPAVEAASRQSPQETGQSIISRS